MLLLVMMLTTAMAWANDAVTYIDMDGNQQTVTEYTEVTESMTADERGDIIWVSGTYVVKNSVTLDGCIRYSGKVINLIVCDGATLTVNGTTTNGAFLGDVLNIYAQSNGTGMGVVDAKKQTNCFNLNIAGGKVTLDAGGAGYGLFIHNGVNYGLTVNGGDVTIQSDFRFQGTICFAGNGFVTLNGGKLTVTNRQGNSDRAIYGKDTNTINFNGGTAVINGEIGSCQNINLNGGNVTVNGEIDNSSGYTVTYDFTSATDSYYIQSFSNNLNEGHSRTVRVKDDKTVLCEGNIYWGTLTDEQIAAISGKTMTPNISDHKPISVNYIDEDGVEKTRYALPLQGGETTLTSGWYVVNDDVEYTGKITLGGDVNIILADGKKMTVTNTDDYAIYGDGKALHIYGQSQGTGALTATAEGTDAISIGYDEIASRDGFLGIHGGVVTASSYDTGIGVYSATADGGIVINGGRLMASGSDFGIYCEGGHFDILGGQVTANGGLFFFSIFEYDDDWNPIGLIPCVLTLGCSKPTDFISTNKIDNYEGEEYKGEVKIAAGQTLVDAGGNIYNSATASDDLAALKNVTLRPVMGVTLTKDGDNISAAFDGTSTTTLSIPVDVTVNSVTYNRTFTEGKPSTVMLPFDYTCTGSEGGTFYKFVGVEKVDDTWVATMKATGDDANNQGTLTANTPYLFMPAGESLTFTGGATLCTMGGGNCETADAGSHWTFRGTYEYKEWITDGANADEIGRVYGFAGVAKDGINVGDFVKVKSGARIRPMGCYLLWSNEPNAAKARALTRGAAATDEELPQSITVRLVGSNGETNGIGTIDTKTGEVTFFDEQSGKAERDSEAWYTLDGVRLDGKPTQKGLYINNGRKIVIK